MTRVLVLLFLASSLIFAACSKKADDANAAANSVGDLPFFGGDQHGRFVGVGIYNPSRQWTRLAANQQAKDPDGARPIDDQVIVVVEDSRTGEVRACGDLTGYCIGMNPWKTALVGSQRAPIALTEHIRPSPDDPDAPPPPPPPPSKPRRHHARPAATPADK